MTDSLALFVWANNLSDGEFGGIAIALSVMAAAGFYFTFRFFRRARLIEDTPTSKIRSAAQGYIEIDGSQDLMGGAPIVSPLTGMKCTWYEFKVEERENERSASGSSSSWRTIRSGTSDEIFLLVDDTGQCIVDPEGAEVTCSQKDVWYGSTVTPPSPLKSSGSRMFSGSGSFRYTERVMLPGQPLYAIGFYKTISGAYDSGDIAGDIRQTLREWKADQAGLLERFDADGDGRIDANEWEQARMAARKEALGQRASQAAKPGTSVLMKPTDRSRPFLLSVLPQTDLAKRFKLYAAGSLAAFFLSGGFVAVLVSVRIMG